MPKKPLINKAGEIRALTREDFKAMRPMREVAPEFVAQFEKAKRARGRPQGRTKAVVSLSLDKEVLALLRAGGAGWQSRVNDLLRAAIGLKG